MLVTAALVYCRCMECRLCVGWVAVRSTYFPRRLGRWSASWDHQSPRHSYKGADPRDESQLHGVQIPTDKIPSLAKGMEGMALENIIEKRKIIMKVTIDHTEHGLYMMVKVACWTFGINHIKRLRTENIFVWQVLLGRIALGFLVFINSSAPGGI